VIKGISQKQKPGTLTQPEFYNKPEIEGSGNSKGNDRHGIVLNQLTKTFSFCQVKLTYGENIAPAPIFL
jgi:hypothetical protein